MPNTTISALPAAAIPYPTGSLFELSVPDGLGGFNSFKGTLADIVAATLVDPQITITGAFSAEPDYLVTPSFGMQSRGQFFSSIGGAAIESTDGLFGSLPNTVTAISLAAVTGVNGNLSIIGNFLDNILLPELAIVNGALLVEGSSTHPTVVDLSNLQFVAQNLSISSFGLGGSTSFPFTKLASVGSSATIPGTGGLSITGFLSLETLHFPVLTHTAGLTVVTCALLTELTAPLLEVVGGGGLSVGTGTAVTSLSFPALTSVGITTDLGQFEFGGTSLASVSFPVLAFIGDFISIDPVSVLTTVNFPALTSTGGFQFWSSPSSLETLTLPVIQHITSPTLIDAGGESLTTFTLGASLLSVAGNMELTSCALTQASVDALLVSLAALDGTAGTTAYSGKTVTITGTSATPSATGLAAKATLVGRGCTVTTN